MVCSEHQGYRSDLLGCPGDCGCTHYCGDFASPEPAAEAADGDEAAPKVCLPLGFIRLHSVFCAEPALDMVEEEAAAKLT